MATDRIDAAPVAADSTGASAGVLPVGELIALRAVSKVYWQGDVQVPALHDVNLSVRRAEFIAIMGPSGSGKSTLLHILGLLDADYGGAYTLAGRVVSGLSSDELAPVRNREIGFVFQQFHLLPALSILENAALPALYARDRSAEQCLADARQRLEQMGLSHRLDHRPNELSIGQRQRAAIARALVNQPSLLLADEPTGALDSKTVREILGILGELNERGTTVVLVTHDRDVAKVAGRVVYVRDGEVFDG
jgi:ABC-type lipoprotein export system ATPase subunit